MKDDTPISYVLDRENKIIKIPFYTKMKWNKQICSLVGATNTVEVCNAKEFEIDNINLKKWKYTLNILLNKKKKPSTFDYDKYEKDLKEILDYIYEKIAQEYNLYFNLTNELKDIINESLISIEYKEKAIIELLKLLRFNSKNANFKHIKHSLAFGKKNDRVIEHATLITQSVAGLKERTYEF